MTMQLRIAEGRQRLHRAANLAADLLARSVSWVLRRKRRLLLLAWVSVMFQIGSASLAHADDLFIGPYQPGSSEATPFERYDTGNYAFLYAPDSNNDGIAGTFDAGVAALEDALFFLGASIVRGALIAMQWMLGLDLYDDNAAKIDTAVQDISNNLMIPLLGITLVIAGFSAYARYRRDGGESIINEVAWVAAGAILAVAFALAPGTFISLADGARGAVGQLVMKTYAAATTPEDKNALGVGNGTEMAGNPQCGAAGTCGDQTALNASRRLTNSLWDAWVNTPWCVAQFRHIDTCSKQDPNYGTTNAGVLLDDDKRADLEKKLANDYSDIQDGDKYEPWGGNDRWIRGMLGGRLGVVLIFFAVSIPMALFLLGLTLFGLMAAIGLLLLVLVGPFFLALWVIPGAPRRAGMQWLHGILTVLLQSVLITLTIGAVAIVTSIINSSMGTYGYFMSGFFNIVALVVAWKMRSALESFQAVGGAAGGGGVAGMTSSGMISSYTAWRLMGVGGRTARRAGRTATRGLGAVGGAADTMSGGTGRLPSPLRSSSSRRSRAPLQSMGSMSTPAVAPLPPRPVGRAGSYANMGVPMSAGEYAREKRARGKDERLASRRSASAARNASVSGADVSSSGPVRTHRSVGRASEKPPAMTFEEHQKNEQKNPAAYTPRTRLKPRMTAVKDMPSMADVAPRAPGPVRPVQDAQPQPPAVISTPRRPRRPGKGRS